MEQDVWTVDLMQDQWLTSLIATMMSVLHPRNWISMDTVLTVLLALKQVETAEIVLQHMLPQLVDQDRFSPVVELSVPPAPHTHVLKTVTLSVLLIHAFQVNTLL